MKVPTVSTFAWALVALAVFGGGPRCCASCPAGWTPMNGRCFQFVPTKLAWARAERVCLSMGANLASVHSAEESVGIQKMILSATHTFTKAWLGGTDAQKEGVWLWSDGSPFDFHHCGEFNNALWSQHCLQMNYGKDKCWDDVQCSSHRSFVCVMKPK